EEDRGRPGDLGDRGTGVEPSRHSILHRLPWRRIRIGCRPYLPPARGAQRRRVIPQRAAPPMKRLHICILTTAHPIDDVRVNEKFARSFLSSGFRVSWVGPAHAYVNEQPALATGIEFHLASENRSKLDRLFSFISVYRKAIRVADVDIYYCPEPDSARLALCLAKRNRAKVILDLHEVYHGPMLTRWLGGLALPAIREFVRKRIAHTCRRCDLVLGVSAAVLDYYFSPSGNRLIVRSCAPAWFSDLPPADVCGDERRQFTIMHGKRSFARGTMAVLEAAAL